MNFKSSSFSPAVVGRSARNCKAPSINASRSVKEYAPDVTSCTACKIHVMCVMEECQTYQSRKDVND